MLPAAHHSCLCSTGIRPVNKRSDMMVLNWGDVKIIQALGFVDSKAILERGVRPAMTTCQRPSSEKKTRS
jgi:hypothetical protein